MMNTYTAVRDRLLQLCGQKNMSLHRLATESAFHCQEHSVRKKYESGDRHHQDALRRIGHLAGGFF